VDESALRAYLEPLVGELPETASLEGRAVKPRTREAEVAVG
jgi:hypothetical protein